uniref:Uncharacterized protein n=1 Tax=Sciurus vulgaris TaxID=55149 RepID=A0A8D2JJN9_SCIVU
HVKIQPQVPPKKQREMNNSAFDPLFFNQNQTRICYQIFLDYHHCIKNMNKWGKSAETCEYYFCVYHSMLPINLQQWVEIQQWSTAPVYILL